VSLQALRHHNRGGKSIHMNARAVLHYVADFYDSKSRGLPSFLQPLYKELSPS
jgi:hypothetical protein